MTETSTFSQPTEATRSPLRRIVDAARDYLPEGRGLPDLEWDSRHRVIMVIIWAHAVGLTAFGFYQGWGAIYSLGEGGLIAALGAVAAWPRLGRRFRSGAAALALVTSSTVFTQFWGGYIEGHFHYFIIVALVILYQDWVPFLLSVGYVAVSHGILGTMIPQWVYNHPEAIAHPWTWAMYHAVLVLGECAVLLYVWKETERSRSQVDMLMNAAGEAILGLDRGGRIAFANPAASALTGRPLSEMLGRPHTDFIEAPPDADPAGVAGNGGTQRRTAGDDMVVVRSDGSRTPVIWARSPIEERGAVVGHVMTLIDATPHKAAEEERRKRLQQVAELEHLKEVNQFKTLFINTAAHELHTPLTPLRLNLFALREGHKGDLTAEQHEIVDILERNVERLSLLVEDVLNAARLQASRLSIERGKVDLGLLVQETLSSFQETAKRDGVHLEMTTQPGLVVDGDGRRLGQVLYNLVDNAIKFTRDGTVNVTARAHDGGALVEVRDSGRGIPPEDQRKLFQPFSQVHDTMELTRSGSGLGLFISKGIVDLHGGQIRCRSEGLGHGSTFSVFLPMPKQHVAA